jgi:hypothetical protein
MKKFFIIFQLLWLGIIFSSSAQSCFTFPDWFPDTVCKTSQRVFISQDISLTYTGPGIIIENHAVYFDPSLAASTGPAVLGISGICNENSTEVTRTVFIKACTFCDSLKFPAGIPETFCNTDKPFLLPSASIRGEGVKSTDGSLFFDPSAVVIESDQDFKIVSLKYSIQNCDSLVMKVKVKRCSSCTDPVFPDQAFEEVCNTRIRNLVLNTTIGNNSDFSVVGKGVIRFGDGYYLDASVYQIPEDSAGKWITLKYIYNACHTGNPEKTFRIYIRNCIQPDCDPTVFPGFLPAEICVFERQFEIISPEDFGYSNYVIQGKGISSKSGTYFFDPSVFSIGDSVTLYFGGFACGRQTMIYKKIRLVDCEISEGEDVLGEVITGIATDNTMDFNVFPNPAETGSVIYAEGDDVNRIQLYDISGKLLKSQDGDQLDLGGTEPGLYIVHTILSSGNVKIARITVQ